MILSELTVEVMFIFTLAIAVPACGVDP